MAWYSTGPPFLGKFPLIFWAIFGRGLIEESELVGYWSIAICGQMQFRNMAGSSYGRRQEWEKNWDSNAIFIAENWWKLASSASKGSISPCLQAMSIRLNVSYFTPHQFTNVSLVISVLSDASYFSRAFFLTLYTVSFLLNKKNPSKSHRNFAGFLHPNWPLGGRWRSHLIVLRQHGHRILPREDVSGFGQQIHLQSDRKTPATIMPWAT